ncbi:MAG: NADH-quinone oxidoreductase subunit N, partial [Candidatus Hydrothermarchaeaceae archaeon]
MNYAPLMPELILICLAMAVIIIGLFLRHEQKRVLGYISIAGLIVSLLITLNYFDAAEEYPGPPLYNAVVVDSLGQFFNALFLIVAILVSIASLKYYDKNPNQDEYYALLLFATAGMMIVAIANDLITLFIGFELATLSTYALAGFDRTDKRSIEAAMKYFIIGALSSAVMLFGMSFIYGMTGSTNLQVISSSLVNSPVAILGMVLLLAGFGFKMALVPFHMWAPDTYEGAPSVVSAFLASASKKMGFVAAFKVLVFALAALKMELYLPLAVIAVATMTLGNVAALTQKSVKRMLAYSSIAHAGYIAIAFVVVSYSADAAEFAIAGGILHALSHAIATAGAFIATAAVAYVVLSHNKNAKDVDGIDNYDGLGKTAPLTALFMTILLLSLAGIPPTFGFYTKFVLFLSAIRGELLWLAIAGVLNSALSVYYYAKVIMRMYW